MPAPVGQAIVPEHHNNCQSMPSLSAAFAFLLHSLGRPRSLFHYQWFFRPMQVQPRSGW